MALSGTSRGGAAAVREEALPLTGPDSLAPLMERIGDARYAAVGEASHGTDEAETCPTGR